MTGSFSTTTRNYRKEENVKMVKVTYKWISVGIATILHFFVDGLCLCCLYLMIPSGAHDDLLGLFLTYNLLAFSTQPLTGWWVDRLQKLHWILLLSIGLLMIAVVLMILCESKLLSSPFTFWMVAILLGMGNSLFHVWGGKMTILVVGNDMRALGIFVSTGAMGLVVGLTYASLWVAVGLLLLIALMGTFAIRIPVINTKFVQEKVFRLNTSRLQLFRTEEIWLIPILLFVFVRSFVGESISLNIEKNSAMLFMLAMTAMVGKAGGGWVARCWGVGASIVACVGVAVTCMLWSINGTNRLLPVLIGVLTINFTMPMTLYLANRVLPGREGQAFGLLAMVLIPGYMLAHCGSLPFQVYFMLAALLLTISVELGMLQLMGEKRRKVFVGSVVINILTNIPLNLVLIAVGSTIGSLLTGELLVLMVEAIGYYILIHEWKRVFIYSLLCNVTSFLVGVLVQFMI